MMKVIKKDGRLQELDLEKIKISILKSRKTLLKLKGDKLWKGI